MYTPGPWACDEDTNEIFSLTEEHGSGWIALIGGNDSNNTPYSKKMQVANSRLISAAPDLLAVARMAFEYAQDTKARFAEYFDGDDAESYDNLCDACEKAIAKAEGDE